MRYDHDYVSCEQLSRYAPRDEQYPKYAGIEENIAKRKAAESAAAIASLSEVIARLEQRIRVLEAKLASK